jgi:ABC-type transport system substrate-binding protein
MTKRYDRRTFLRHGGRAAGGLLLAGAAPAVLDACGAGQAPVARTPGRPRRGGGLTFATEAEINSFDPRVGAWDATGLTYARAVYDPLFVQAADGSIQPYLALSIAPNTDYTEWTMKLRPGVRFHDGSPLDANTVRVNLLGLAEEALDGPALFDLAGVKAVDPLTVLITMHTPWVPFPFLLTVKEGMMVGLKQLAASSGRSAPVGTGAFVFKEWVPGDHFTATRNPNYWRPGLPYLDSITFKPIPDSQSRENSLRAGNIDVMHSSDTQNVANLVHDPQFHQINDLNSTLGEPDMGFVMLNTAMPPLDDIRVRQALAYATDRQRFIRTLANGLTRPADGPFVQGSPYYAPTGYPGYDPARARALVAEYVREKGPISFRHGNVNTPKARAGNALLGAMWQEVGIQTDDVFFEQSPYIQNAIVGNFQAYGWRQFNGPDPDANLIWWSSATAAAVGKQALNFARNRDPLIEAALVAGRTQVDPTVRSAAYRMVASRLAVDLPYIWVDQAVWIVAGRMAVGGIGRATLPDGGPARPLAAGVTPIGELWLTR